MPKNRGKSESNKFKHLKADTLSPANFQKAGHYTQIVWENSKRIGIGKAVQQSTGRVFIVCNYDPPGNYGGVRPFQKRDNVVVQQPPVKEQPPVVQEKPPVQKKPDVQPPQKQPTGSLFAGTLSTNSPIHDGRRYAQYRMKLDAGRTYTMELNGQFDTWLMLFKTDGTPLANNDDISQTNRNSRLVFTPQVTAEYAIIVTSFRKGDTGSYTLSVK